MNTRPVVVAAHIVPVLLAVRAIAATKPPARVVPPLVDLDEITAARLRPRRGELWAIRLESRLIPAPVLGPPDALRALEDRPSIGGIRVSDDRRVEVRAFRATRDWRGDDDPLQRIAIPKVRIVVLTEERIEPHGRVRHAKARLTTIAVNDLWPDHCRAICLKSSVVLRAALKMLRIISSN